MTNILISFYILWFTVNVLYQFSDPLRRVVGKYFAFGIGLISNWQLFAPVPRHGDYMIRLRLVNRPAAGFGKWHEIPFFRPKSGLHMFFNPNADKVRCIVTMIESLKWEGPEQAIQRFSGANFLSLLTLVRKAAEDFYDEMFCDSLQFKVSVRRIYGEKVLFKSPVYDL